MIPNVTISWCQQSAKCRYDCGEPIEPGTPVVRVFFWNRGNEDGRKWNVKHYYHPQCWIDQGLDYLKMNPYIQRKRGPAAKLSEEQTKERLRLLRRYSQLTWNKRRLQVPYPDRLLFEARIEKKQVDILLDLVKLGGMPKSWLKAP